MAIDYWEDPRYSLLHTAQYTVQHWHVFCAIAALGNVTGFCLSLSCVPAAQHRCTDTAGSSLGTDKKKVIFLHLPFGYGVCWWLRNEDVCVEQYHHLAGGCNSTELFSIVHTSATNQWAEVQNQPFQCVCRCFYTLCKHTKVGEWESFSSLNILLHRITQTAAPNNCS